MCLYGVLTLGICAGWVGELTVVNNNLANEITHLNAEIVKLEENILTLESNLKYSAERIETLEIELARAKTKQFDNLTIPEMFRIASNTYNVDYSMLYAIGRLESGNFTSSLFVNKNNVGGMRYDGEWLSYSSKLEGIMELARLLRRNYIDQGLTTPETIGKKYCPDTADDWARKVRAIMVEEN